MRLIDYDKAIWGYNKYYDINVIQNRDGNSPGYPPQDICPMCHIIDSLCHEYYMTTNQDRKDEILNKLQLFEINAYKLLKLFESLGHVALNPTNIDNINHFLYSNKYTIEELENLKIVDININDVRIESTRWCSTCGARKPDIIE